MTTYAKRADLNRFFSQANVTDWADKDRSGDELSEDELMAIDAVIDAAEAKVDSALTQAGYDAPFEGAGYASLAPKTKAILKQWTVILAGYLLYSWRGLQNSVNPFETINKTTLDELAAVAKGAPVVGLSPRTRVASGKHRHHMNEEAWNW